METNRQFLNGDASNSNSSNKLSFCKKPRFIWWFLLILNTLFLIFGQTCATLLGRFYYDQGGNSKWIATLVQTAGFPFLFIPLIFVHPSSPSTSSPKLLHLMLVYFILGVIIVCDNLMYSYGLLYLPVSTYSLICASQLGFNSIFSYFINKQKFTILILNSVILLTFSAALLGVNQDSDSNSSNISKYKYILGFLLTLGASATYSLILSLMQFSFEKIIKRETFSIVLDMQIYTSLVATCFSIIGLFASGEWRLLSEEMVGFKSGKVSYILTLIWTGVAWQLASVGVVGLVFVVSSLFSNVISTLALPIVPVFAVIFFKDKMDAVKIIAMLIAIWGFVSYIYQHYLDDLKGKRVVRESESGGNGDNRV